MTKTSMKYPVSVISGLLFMVIFWTFTGIAIYYYPGNYNPLTNWMSDLGHMELNPKGHIYFNIGCIISGILLVPFFIGLYEWYIGERRNVILTIMTQIAGVYSGFAMVMIGVFPEHYWEIHIFWAIMLFTTTILTFILPSLALYKYKFTRNIAIYGFAATVVNLVLWLFIYPVLEWTTIIASFGFIGLIIHSMYKRIDKLRAIRLSLRSIKVKK
ncbi:MAG: DUF998 domain-containing protein [Candidatus Lokiarchaeota archaeon]|nr:DUF998 domain-containing protein [Candidatus Lokiarchaeota archaeon]